MIGLALRSLRLRPGSAIGTFIAVFFGAAIVFAFGALLETGIHGEAVPQRMSAATAVITGNQSFELPRSPGNDKDDDTETAILPERVRIGTDQLATIARLPGVQAAIGDVSFDATILRDGAPVGQGRTLGHSYSSTRLGPYTVSAGRSPIGPNQVVVDTRLAGAGVQVGDRVPIVVAGIAHIYQVSGIVAGPTPTRDLAVFFEDQVATTLAGHPENWDAIGVLATPAADPATLAGEIRQSTPNLTVLTGNERGAAEFGETLTASGDLVVLSAVAGGNSILVAIFVIFATLTLVIQQRGRELALLRAIGTTPRQLRRMVTGEAVVIALIAGAIGWLPGRWLAQWLFDRLADNGVIPSVLSFHAGWLPMVVAVGSAVLTSLAAAILVGRRAAVIRPTEALAEPGESRRWLTRTRFVVAMLAFGGGTALVIVTLTVFDGPVAASTAGPSVFLWALGLAMVSPGITRLMTRLVRWPMRLFTGAAGYLAVINASARPVRMAAAVTPIMLATGLATAMIYLQTTSIDAGQRAYTEALRADAVVGSSAGGLGPQVLNRIESVPQVAGASESVTSTVFVQTPYYDQDGDGITATGITARGSAQSVDPIVRAGNIGGLTGNTVALPADIADATGLTVGGHLTLIG